MIFPKVALCIPPGSCGRHVRSAPHVDAMSTTRAEWPRNGSVVLAMQPCREMDQGLIANYYWYLLINSTNSTNSTNHNITYKQHINNHWSSHDPWLPWLFNYGLWAEDAEGMVMCQCLTEAPSKGCERGNCLDQRRYKSRGWRWWAGNKQLSGVNNGEAI